jgi:diphosphomevalonate decarboxylase
MSRIVAIAHSNIALAKYWGKGDSEKMLAAVPSLSMTLEALTTRTSVEPSSDLSEDDVRLGGHIATGRPRERVVRMLSRIREAAGSDQFARVQSENDFPTASGLASSASGFAALAVAATHAYGVGATLDEQSRLARQASISAARSVFGGFVALEAGAETAVRVAPADFFDLAMAVVVTTTGEKDVGSSEGMARTVQTSAYYPAWVSEAPRIYERARGAILARDLTTLGEAVEQSALMMHATMMAAIPPILYFNAATLAVIEAVRALRREGMEAYFTMDAGPHVKVLTRAADLAAIAERLSVVPGVVRVIQTGIGPDAHVVEAER